MSAQANKNPKKDQQPPKDQQDGAAQGGFAPPGADGGPGGELGGANPPGDIEGSAEYEVIQPIYGVDTPGVRRMPGYRFTGPAVNNEPLVKLGYLKRV